MMQRGGIEDIEHPMLERIALRSMRKSAASCLIGKGTHPERSIELGYSIVRLGELVEEIPPLSVHEASQTT